jgi:hypothetical protein
MQVFMCAHTHTHTHMAVGIIGIATRHCLDGPGIESRCRRDFPYRSDGSRGPPSLLYDPYWAIPGGKAAGAWC